MTVKAITGPIFFASCSHMLRICCPGCNLLSTGYFQDLYLLIPYLFFCRKSMWTEMKSGDWDVSTGIMHYAYNSG